MSRLIRRFARAQAQGRAAFMPFALAGFPSPGQDQAVLRTLESAGADLIELGLPWPHMPKDGPAIRRAAAQALRAGAHPLRTLHSLAQNPLHTPVILMTYWQALRHTGPARLARAAARAKVAAVLVPDLPPLQARPWRRILREHHLEPVFLASLDTPAVSIAHLEAGAGGFLYLALGATTGGRLHLDGSTRRTLRRLRQSSPLPVAVGFGVSRPGQARRLAGLAGGVVVGSALVRALEAAPDFTRGLERMTDLARRLAAALQG
jgi:tryptophan synthase alpha chain